MNITLYKTISDRSKLVKTLTDVFVLTGSLKDNANMMNPVILFTIDPSDFNYMYIPDWKRYYYIDSVDCYRTKAWIARCSEDVLMSFNTEIKKLTVVTSRLASEGSYVKGNASLNVKPTITKIEFPNSILEYDKGSLICVGKGGN